MSAPYILRFMQYAFVGIDKSGINVYTINTGSYPIDGLSQGN